MNYSHIIWDFNGTLFDDVETGIKSINALLSKRNMQTLSGVADYHKVFGFPIIEYYRALGFDFDAEPYDKIANEWIEQYLYFSKGAKLYDGAKETLEKISKLPIKQIILSATEKNMLVKQLSELEILPYFSEVLGLDNIYAYSKAELGKMWKEREKPKKVLLIGDTVHDFETSKQIGADCILVSCGHQSRDTLLSCGVTVINNIKDIVKYV